ncbi:UPF0187 domain membrane protein [Lineolata rhizophorae]|uniref:UPF0187 domain membrane protein n=1 Tax=Lineolata rhizophorae TaxID=578093 RepID=A0A6A6P2J5_9PEZI|nr:UPF0187 domain membrane protein [Lineolata rhizophorae]
MQPVGVSSLLLTVLGIVVGLGLSFRTATAYERYTEGRKYWSQLMLCSHELARLIWIHIDERQGEMEKEDLLGKVTALNMIAAFAYALKHRVRFEPGIQYDDMRGLVQNMSTFAKAAEDGDGLFKQHRKTPWKATGEYLGVPFAESNPRKLVKRSKKPLGNLPMEILNHLSAYLGKAIKEERMEIGICQANSMSNIAMLTDVLTGVDRVLNTPLPLAYTIAISQITWVYVLLLPFQLYPDLGWITIPGTIFAAYIIIGLAAIGSEIENPFGNDVNDLPLDDYCDQLASELDIIASSPPPNPTEFIARNDNIVLYPLSQSSYLSWKRRSITDIRAALRTKTIASVVNSRKSMQTQRQEETEQPEHVRVQEPTPPPDTEKIQRSSQRAAPTRAETLKANKKVAAIS